MNCRCFWFPSCFSFILLSGFFEHEHSMYVGIPRQYGTCKNINRLGCKWIMWPDVKPMFRMQLSSLSSPHCSVWRFRFWCSVSKMSCAPVLRREIDIASRCCACYWVSKFVTNVGSLLGFWHCFTPGFSLGFGIRTCGVQNMRCTVLLGRRQKELHKHEINLKYALTDLLFEFFKASSKMSYTQIPRGEVDIVPRCYRCCSF